MKQFSRHFYKRAVPPVIQKKEISFLIHEIRMIFNELLKTEVSELNLNYEETLKTERNLEKLRKAYKECNLGNLSQKEFIKSYINDLLQKKIGISPENIEESISFDNEKHLTIQDKFEIVLHIYKKKYKFEAFNQIMKEYDLSRLRDGKYEVNKDDIVHIYKAILSHNKLDYADKLDIVTQRIYQQIKGHGSIDELRDQHIDGISGGVSGIPIGFYDDSLKVAQNKMVVPYSYDSIWVFYKGKTTHLSFLGFGSQKELERVCKNIYRFDTPGQLSAASGYIVNEMADGSRVVVTRPPFSESWVFLIRKFGVDLKDIGDLITDTNCKLPINILKFIIKGCQVTAFTGMQGTGKTTILKAIMPFINDIHPLRIQEMTFELWLRKAYPYRNILTFRETGTVTGQEGLDLQKKTDGAVNILGEVATLEVALWLVQISQVASLFTLFTHHAKNTKSLVNYFRNALLKEGGFNNEKIAEQQVVEAIRFDVHLETANDGHRYIERITEIVPIQDDYKMVDIVSFEDQKYVFKNEISSETQKEMCKRLTKEEAFAFHELMKSFRGEKI